jgi:hypothetical protein
MAIFIGCSPAEIATKHIRFLAARLAFFSTAISTLRQTRFGTLEAWHAIAWGTNPHHYPHFDSI